MVKTTIYIVTIIISLLLNGCSKHPIISLVPHDQKKIIALQPLDDYNGTQLEIIRNEISSYFNRRVIILNPVNIPATSYYPALNKYSADSIVTFLSTLNNNTIIEVIGLMNKPIFIAKQDKDPTIVPEVQDVHGLADMNGGGACVISDYRLLSTDSVIYFNKLRAATFHEVGHNIGLDHCSVDSCIMSERNGNIGDRNISAENFCNDCKRILRR